MELVYDLGCVGVHDEDGELDDLLAGLDLFVANTSRLKIQHQQVPEGRLYLFGRLMKGHRVYLGFGEYSCVFFVEFNTDVADVGDVVNTTVMAALVRNLQGL